MNDSRFGMLLPVVVLLALAPMAGCRGGRSKAAQPEGPPPPTHPIAGVFQGEWWGGPRVYYAIEHPLDDTPIVTAPSNPPGGWIEITNVCRDGRILSFDQIECEPVPGAHPSAGAGSAMHTSCWAVSLQISMYDCNRALMQIRRADETTGIQRLLHRHLRRSDFAQGTNALSTGAAAP